MNELSIIIPCVSTIDTLPGFVDQLAMHLMSNPSEIDVIVVANEEIPEHEEVIKESGGGVLVRFEAESFVDGIIELLDDSDKARGMGGKGHEWVVENRSYENMAREVEKRYFEVLKGKSDEIQPRRR